MSAATGWSSQLGWDIGDITGATEDWNDFAQGLLGGTPEGKGLNSHGGYGTVVAGEDARTGTRGGVRKSCPLAAEPRPIRRPRRADGTAPPGAELRLTNTFRTPTCQAPTLFVDDVRPSPDGAVLGDHVEELTMQGASHLLHIQRPEPVAHGMASFLRRNPIAAAPARAPAMAAAPSG